MNDVKFVNPYFNNKNTYLLGIMLVAIPRNLSQKANMKQGTHLYL